MGVLVAVIEYFAAEPFAPRGFPRFWTVIRTGDTQRSAKVGQRGSAGL